ncbi:MAG: hypothetical protein ABIQ74_05370 [Chitinophagales bacterium]
MRIKNSFVLGILTGIGIGYYLATDDKEQFVDDVKGTINKVKDVVDEGFQKGKRVVSNLKSKTNGGEDFS